MNYQDKANDLYKQQEIVWPQLAENLKGLNEVKYKTFTYDACSLKIQFNPKRIISASAKVDNKSIDERKCFLCKNHRPLVQTEVEFADSYEILCNPFPIFPKHFTIAHKRHIKQSIDGKFTDLLKLTKALPELFTLYNGPKCGASAPDHFHFQAASKGYLPIENELPDLINKYGEIIPTSNNSIVTAIDDGFRRFLVLSSDNIDELTLLFSEIYKQMPNKNNNSEPMMNILAWHDSKWTVLVFFRENHRPWQYFEEGESNILISPGATDYGGVLITPLAKDFSKVTKTDLSDILNQTSLNSTDFENFCAQLSLK